MKTKKSHHAAATDNEPGRLYKMMLDGNQRGLRHV